MTTPSDLEELHELCQLKYRYPRGIGTQDFELVEGCFTEDAKAWFAGGAFSFNGRDQLIAFLRAIITPELVSRHIVVHPELTLVGPHVAKGIWRLRDVVHFTSASPVYSLARLVGGKGMTGAAYYHGEYVKRDGIWKMSSIGFIRIFKAVERPLRTSISASVWRRGAEFTICRQVTSSPSH